MKVKPYLPLMIVIVLLCSHVLPVAADSSPPWRAAVEAIEQAKIEGLISVDEAALFRLQALKDPAQLQEQFRPPAQPLLMQAEEEQASHCGLSEVTNALNVLTLDQEQWSEETRAVVNSEIEAAMVTPADLDQVHETEHFAIYWADDGTNKPPGGFVYIQTLAEGLERAWDHFENDLGYAMPDAQEFGVTASADDAFRFPVDVISEIRFIARVPANAVSLPGKMWFAHFRGRQFLNVDTAHELFHMVQWGYAGYTDSSPLGLVKATTWYASNSAWLMESTSTWTEKEMYPASDNWVDKVIPYINQPDRSLYSYTPLDVFEYGAVIFIDFLEEHVAERHVFGNLDYDPKTVIVKNIWEEVHLQGGSTIDAVAQELMNPPSGDHPFTSTDEVWQDIFADFAVANYRRDYHDGSEWKGLVNRRTERPIAGEVLILNLLGPERAAAQYIDILSTGLALPGGADATGATLQVVLGTICNGCSLEVLQYPGDVRTSYALDPDISMETILAEDFGTPGGTDKLVLALINGIDPKTRGANYRILATDNPPIAPENLNASVHAGPPKVVHLTWGAVEEDDIRYRVYRDTASHVAIDEQHLLTELHGLEYEDGNAEPGTTYYYAVTPVDTGDNEGLPSNQVSALIPAPTPTPTPTPTLSSITIEINAGVDDAGPNPDSGCSYHTDWNEVYFGECFDGSDVTSGFRFVDVQIPPGAEIQEAFLRFTTNGPYENPLSLRIYGEASANASLCWLLNSSVQSFGTYANLLTSSERDTLLPDHLIPRH
jgi:hypothetical protein